MPLYDFRGRVSFDYILMNDGTLIIPGTNLTMDGEPVFEFIDHTVPIYAFTSDFHEKAVVGSLINYTIVLSCTNNADPRRPLTVSVPIPGGFTLVNAETVEGVYNSTTGKWTVTLVNQQASLNLLLEPVTVGEQPQLVVLDGTILELSKTCEIVATDTGAIVSHEGSLEDYPVTVANLQPGKLYTVISYSKVIETGVTGIHTGVKNNRLSVVNGVEVFGSRATIQNNIQKIVTAFIYDSSNPVIIRRYSEYESVSLDTDDLWYGLCINEGFNTVYSQSTNLLTNPEALFDDTGSTDLTIPGNSESAEYVYEFSPTTTPSNEFFTGILMTLNSFGAVASGIQAQIKTDERESEIKTTFLTPSQRMSLGDVTDNWSLNQDYIQNKALFAHLKIRNTILNQQSFNYSNLTLTLYSAKDETGGAHTIIYNGVHGRIHGLSIDADRNPEGPQFNLETLTMAFMDGELPIRFNITSKELEIDFTISGNTLEEAQTRLRSISRWFKNSRTLMSRPVYNSLIFTYDLTKEYFVIFKDVIEVEKNITSLVCTAKFYVPDGVARSIEPVVSGPIGSNAGEIRVWPLIEVKTDGSSQLVVRDTVTGNTITLNDSPGENTTLYIDCEKRTITDDAGNEYQTDLALNTVWINFLDEYSITTTGGVFQQLSYRPGY
jgi:predicted phage tail component-like protein